ncbi:MAG TPA: questin oxidase family protein [Dongiaceae bacterium]|jgi:hypothetical protein
MLKDLLAKTRLYHPSYRGGLCNHAPMALIALDRMGASPPRLEAFARMDLQDMEPAPQPGSAIDAANWRERLGEEAAYADYLGFFQREVARLNGRAALRAYLPALVPGLAAAAFHPMIRTAFGVIAEDGGEIATGLAYWASRYLAFPEAQDETVAVDPWLLPAEDPQALLTLLREQNDLEFQPDPDNLIDRELDTAAGHPRFPGIVNALNIDDLTLGRLRQAAAMLYLSSGDFSSLHGVTGLHAARVLSDYTDDHRAFANAVWQALLALYLSLNRPELPSAEALAAATAVDLPDWNTILPAAVASDDDHVIKLVFACLAETRAGGGRIYHLLAAQKAGLVAPRAGGQSAIESQSEAPAVAAGR